MKVNRATLWLLAAIAVLLAINAIGTPGFLVVEWRDGRLYGSMIDVLNRAAPVMLIALGMTLVIGTAGVDLSVGAVMAITGALAAGLVARPEYSPLARFDLGGSVALIVVVAVGVAALAGLFNGLLVGVVGIQPIVATLVLMVAGRGVAQLLTNGQIVTFTNPELAWLGTGAALGLPVPVWIAALALGAIWLLTRATAFGLFVEAVGSNAKAARLVGIDARRVKLAAYTLTGALAGIAGVIACADIRGADANNAGLYVELDAILAVCVGGTALSGGRISVSGSVLGAIFMQLLTTTLLGRGVSPHLALVVKAAVILALCLAQSPAFREWRREGRRSIA